MGEIGSDPEQLDRLADEMFRAAESLGTGRSRTDRFLATVPWWGPDARRFHSEWSARRGQLGSATDLLQAAARRLRAEAAQQRSSSEGGGDGAVAGPGAAVIPTVHPSSTERWGLGVAGGAGIGAAAEGVVTIDDLPGSKSRVTVSVEGSGGGGVGIGGGTEIHGEDSMGAEGRADVEGALVGTRTTTWLVPDDEAKGFAGARVVDAAMEQSPTLSAGNWLWDHIVGSPAPEPESVTTLGGLSWGAAAASTVGIASLRGEGTNTAQVGLRRRGGTTTQVLHLNGAGAATVTGMLLGGSAPRSTGYEIDSEIEVFPAEGDTRTIAITTTSVDGDEVTRVLSRVTIDQGAAGPTIDDAWEHLGRGDLDGALRRLGDLPDAVQTVSISSVTGDLDGDIWGGTATGSDGPRGHVGVEVTHQSIDWDRPGPTLTVTRGEGPG